MTTAQVEGYEMMTGDVLGNPLQIASYRLGDMWVCTIDHVATGAAISRSTGTSREDAIESAVFAAQVTLNRITKVRRPPMVEGAGAVESIEILRGSETVSISPEQFLSLPPAERMQHCFTGTTRFLDPNGRAVPTGQALECLSRMAA